MQSASHCFCDTSQRATRNTGYKHDLEMKVHRASTTTNTIRKPPPAHIPCVQHCQNLIAASNLLRSFYAFNLVIFCVAVGNLLKSRYVRHGDSRNVVTWFFVTSICTILWKLNSCKQHIVFILIKQYIESLYSCKQGSAPIRCVQYVETSHPMRIKEKQVEYALCLFVAIPLKLTHLHRYSVSRKYITGILWNNTAPRLLDTMLLKLAHLYH